MTGLELRPPPDRVFDIEQSPAAKRNSRPRAILRQETPAENQQAATKQRQYDPDEDRGEIVIIGRFGAGLKKISHGHSRQCGTLSLAQYYGKTGAHSTLNHLWRNGIFIAAPQWRPYMSGPNRRDAMRAEIERTAEEIKQALDLLRRHL